MFIRLNLNHKQSNVNREIHSTRVEKKIGESEGTLKKNIHRNHCVSLNQIILLLCCKQLTNGSSFSFN